MTKNNKAEDISMELAWCLARGEPMPDNLVDELMREVCAEEKQKRERRKLSDGSKAVA